ncbi:class I SAM-dependent methyltransferase [Lentzea sp. PSKA42]|uniref:Class I SAM-dependent methyltransferase n=1 Tax=Lentzea indica TaxID=2604800 RepID=A0ABX1FNW6_9PSEU|nr:class I SAM-dependent methyltransferase [Lentzea indica]NKE60685.1 class I SAM-dependent methyltransferase [Lentzea indica]
MVVDPEPVPWSRHTYDGLAPAYAAANRTIRRGLVPYADRLLAHAGTGLVLELGCGSGRDLQHLESLGANVVGIDLSAGMLAESRRQVAAPLVQGDVRGIPLRAGAVAGCWCVATLLHLPPEQLRIAFAELARVIAVGGMLVLGTQRGSSSALELDPYTGQYMRLMTRHSPEAIVDGLTAHGFRTHLESSTVDDLRGWVLVTAIRHDVELRGAQ